jgi:hypothetical protein
MTPTKEACDLWEAIKEQQAIIAELDSETQCECGDPMCLEKKIDYHLWLIEELKADYEELTGSYPLVFGPGL